jgi:aarF domain-containing kinase
MVTLGLKIGQMLSIQDNKMLPKVVSTALARARDNADVMPRAQLHRVLEEDWGGDWRSRVRHFDETPFAAASIGEHMN